MNMTYDQIRQRRSQSMSALRFPASI